jgi:hypothetical protein
LLRQVARSTRHGTIPFVLVADFNVDAGVLEAEELIADMDAVVVRPQGGAVSCHQGRGSLIDMVVASRAVVPLLEDVRLEPSVPWNPHDAIRITVRKCAKGIMTRRLMRPRGFDDPVVTKESGRPYNLGWDQAMRLAKEQVEGAVNDLINDDTSQKTLMEKCGAGQHAIEVTRRLAVWSRAAELQALAARGVPLGSEAAEAALGRGQRPRIVTVRVMPKRCSTSAQRITGGYTEEARLWATLRAGLARLRVAVVHGGGATRCSATASLIELAAGVGASADKAWATVRNPENEAAARLAAWRACTPGAAEAEIDAAMALMERLEKAEVDRAGKEANRRWHAWVAWSLRNGAGAAHRWARAPDAMTAEVTSPNSHDPIPVADHHAGQWAEVWRASNADKVEETLNAIRDLRARALLRDDHGQVARAINAQTILAGARAFRATTAIGADCQSFVEVATATEEARTELAEVMKYTVTHLAWPLQALLVLLSLLGKKAGGTRAIAVIASYARLLLHLIKDPVRRWDDEVGHEGDSAMRGKKPADETARRLMRVEVAALLGRHVAMVLWDMAKFFDSMDTQVLIESAERLDFPRDQLALGLMLHKAPRVVRARGCCGEQVPNTARSVLAGCTLSTSFARACVNSVRQHCPDGQGHTLSQHVDDLTQTVITRTRGAMVARAVQCGRRLAQWAELSGLTVADKSRVVSNHLSAATAIAQGIRGGEVAVPISAAAAADDLGVSTAAGRRRVTGSFAKRLSKAKRRAERGGHLAAVNGAAQKLYSSGVAPQEGYDAPVIGASPAQVIRMRRNACASVVPAGSQACPTSLIAWRLGPEVDPAVREPVRQVSMWMRLWETSNRRDKEDIRKAWTRAIPRVLLGGVHWGRVTGPLQATVATLGQLGWTPNGPTRWLTPSKEHYADIEDPAPTAAADIVGAIKETAEMANWKGAAAHHLGGGLEEGTPSMEPARAARKWLTRRGRATEAKALDMVVCGGAWHGGRANLRRKCRCGQEETPFHRYWGCHLLETMTDERGERVVAGTQGLQQEIAEHWMHYQCWWGRAILPRSFLEVGEPIAVEGARTTSTGNVDEVLNGAGVAYTDGSGGPRSAPKGHPVAGSGVAAIRWEAQEDKIVVDDVAVLASEVPGRQTVPRAELWATNLVADRAATGTRCTNKADASYVVHNWSDAKRRGRMSATVNGDLWHKLQSTVKEREVDLTTLKVEAHVDPEAMVNEERSIGDFLGNHLADAAAGAAAERALSGSVRAAAVARWESRTVAIARRLASIEAWHWANSEPAVYAPPAPLEQWVPPDPERVHEELRRRVAEKGHDLYKLRGKVACRKCHRRRAPGASAFWIDTECKPAWGKRRGAAGAVAPPPRSRRRVGDGDILDVQGMADGDDLFQDTHVGDYVNGLEDHDELQGGGHARGGYGGDPMHDISACDGGLAGSDDCTMAANDDAGHDARGFEHADGGTEERGREDTKRRRISEGGYDDGMNLDFCDDGDPFGHIACGMDSAGDEVAAPARERRGQEAVGAAAGTDNGSSQFGAGSSGDVIGVQLTEGSLGTRENITDDGTQARRPERSEGSAHDREPQRRRGEDVVEERPHPPADPAAHLEDAVSRGVRRRMVLEQLAEARKRRRMEGEALNAAWGGLVAAVGVQELLDIPAGDDVPPDDAHATHSLMHCGGYLGCVRCGKVVGWQGRDRLKEICRGTCPRGSVRAIRRLAKGLHPYAREGQTVNVSWPSGETAPTPRRWRVGVG